MRKRSRITILAVAVTALLFCLPWTLVGKTPDGNKVRKYVADAPVREPAMSEWVFSADRVVGDHTSEYVEAFGNCSLTMGDDQLRADFARYYRATGWVFLKGNIRAQWGGDFLQAEEGEFDLNNMTGWLKNGKLFMAKPHIYVEADRVVKTAGDTYKFKNAKVTSCEGEQPAWSVTTEEGDVTLDGRIRLYRSAFRIKNVPVFWWPYMSLPGPKKRQSGFLMPYVSSSKKLGMQVNLPYYWVINDEMDATFYQNYMSKRGYMQGVEFRHTEDASSKGMWRVDFLQDSERATKERDEWEDYQGDGLIRPNRDRWWVRSKYDGWLGSPKWKVKLDLDLVSDQNYLRDFQDGPNGFEATREEFLDAFGRDIDNKDETHRYSTAFMSRSWDRYGLTGKVEYDQNLEVRNSNGKPADDESVQTVPEINGFAFQQSLFGSPLEASLDTKYNYFHREKGNSGHRFRATPELKLPMSAGGITLIPSMGADLTTYSLTSHERTGTMTYYDTGGREVSVDTDKIKDGNQMRATWSGGLSTFSEISRVYNISQDLQPETGLAGTSKWTRLKHSVMPRVRYHYTPRITGQSKLPYFDRDDRLDGENRLTYSLTNVLDRRRDTVTLKPGEGGQPSARVLSDYLDFLNFRLEQSYDVFEAHRKDQVNTYERRPFSDVLAELRLKPESFIDILARTWFSPYKGDMTQSEATIRLHRAGLGEFSVGYDFQESMDEYLRQREDRMSIIRLGAKWEISESMTLGARYRHDFESDRDIERTLSLDWAAECYTLYFSFTQKPNDNRFEVGFDLLNF